MIVRFNPTGTHTKGGFLKIRLDLYPDVTSKTYPLHYVDVMDEEGNPTREKQLNPCLCHFVEIDQNTSLASLDGILKEIFDKETLNQLDDLLSKLDSLQVAKIMRAKVVAGEKLDAQVDVAKLIDKLNSRFAGLEIEV